MASPGGARILPASLRRWAARAGVAVVVGLVIGAGSGVFAVNALEPGRPEQPDSLQLMLDSATASGLPNAKDRITIRRELDSAAQAELDRSVDSLAIEAAAGGVAVPELVGMDEGSARAVIASVGFSMGAVQTRPSRLPAGTVLSATPSGHTFAAPGSPIALVLSNGRIPPDSPPPPPAP